MFCPSCENYMEENVSFCGRCGMFMNKKSDWMVSMSNNFAWVWRRSWAGFSAAFIGWIIALGISRMIGQNLDPILNGMFSGMICGVFLGTVGGIIEESGYKAFLGGILGTIGGAMGGFVNIPVIQMMQGMQYSFPVAFLFTWAIGGAFIGATSGIIERSPRKMLAGVSFGLIGGALGGFLGSLFYASMMADFSSASWLANRLMEGVSGGFVGAILWFNVGIIEKLYIFHRKEDPKLENKICDHCKHKNNLRFWYCVKCGYPLQFAAPRQKIVITPFRAMERVVNSFKFISWLFGVTGVIITPVIFFIFLFQDVFLAILSVVISILFSYFMVVIFRFFADLLSALIKITSALSQK